MRNLPDAWQSLEQIYKNKERKTKNEVCKKTCQLFAGAGYVVVYMGNIMTMPGLAKDSNYKYIDIDSDGNIKGLF